MYKDDGFLYWPEDAFNMITEACQQVRDERLYACIVNGNAMFIGFRLL